MDENDSSNLLLLKCIGEIISERREKLGMTQDELAARSGVNRSFISNIEKGRRNPSISSVANLAKGLKMKFSVLLARSEARLP